MTHKLSLIISIALFSSVIFAQKQETKFNPIRYQTALTKAIKVLEKKKEMLAEKLAQTKKRVQAAQPIKKNVRFQKVPSTTLVAQGNTMLQGTLQEALAAVDRRLASLQQEQKKSAQKNNITSIAEEDSAIKKLTLQNRIDDLAQQIVEAKKMEQFFDAQQLGKTQQEKNALTNMRRSWVQKREKLEDKQSNAQFALRNIR